MISPAILSVLEKRPSRSFVLKNTDGLFLPITPDINGFGVMFWWKPFTIGQDHALFNWESTFDRNGVSFRQNNGGALAVVGSNASSTVFVLTNGSNEVANLWIHVAFTYNTSKQARVWKNASQILIGSGTITSNVTTPALGRRSHSDSMRAYGLMKDVVFQNTNTDWSSTQITEHYKRGIVPTGATEWDPVYDVTDKTGSNRMTFSGTPNLTYNVPNHLN